jgi:hypothetical protein
VGRDLRGSDEGCHQEEHFALASAAKTTLAVRRSAPFLGGAETVLAEQTAERLPAERNSFDLAKLLTEMMIVKTNIAGAGEMQDTLPHTRRKAARAIIFFFAPSGASAHQMNAPHCRKKHASRTAIRGTFAVDAKINLYNFG